MNHRHSGLFEEDRCEGNPFRSVLLEQVYAVLAQRREESHARREDFPTSSASLASYEEAMQSQRQELKAMLGWPLDGSPISAPECELMEMIVGEDQLSTIYRMQIPVLGPLQCYGLFFLPKGNGPFRLVIAQHGGTGKPEEVAGFFDSANYNNLARRVLERGYAVFAPQLLLTWADEFGPKYDQKELDIAFKQVGGSMASLQVYMIQRALDHLLQRKDILPDGAAMVGLSYGGFYTLATAACDPRIRTVISSCFINDRIRYGWSDWTWFNSANRFLDREFCALVCPRPLYLEVGARDQLFDASPARAVGKAVHVIYEKLGIPDRFAFVEFDGTHEFNPGDAPLDFLVKHCPPEHH